MGETIILVADTEITDITRIMVEGMDPKVTVHLHTEATEHLTEVITPQVMEDTTRIARSSEVMAATEATNLEDMEATSSEVMEASEATSLEVMVAMKLIQPQAKKNTSQNEN